MRLKRCGAVLVFGKGRHCEIAVVAAAGSSGVASDDIVSLRREYAAHLGVTLAGPVQDADWPIHIDHAIENYKGNPKATHPINMGRARAERVGDRYRVQWPTGA